MGVAASRAIKASANFISLGPDAAPFFQANSSMGAAPAYVRISNAGDTTDPFFYCDTDESSMGVAASRAITANSHQITLGPASNEYFRANTDGYLSLGLLGAAMNVTPVTMSLGPGGSEYFLATETHVKLKNASADATLLYPPQPLTGTSTTPAAALVPGAVGGTTYGGGTYTTTASSTYGSYFSYYPFSATPHVYNSSTVWKSGFLYDGDTGFPYGATTVSNVGTLGGEYIQITMPTAMQLQYFEWVRPILISSYTTTGAYLVASNVGAASWNVLIDTNAMYAASRLYGVPANLIYQNPTVSDTKTYTQFRLIITLWNTIDGIIGPHSYQATVSSITMKFANTFTNPLLYLSDDLTVIGGFDTRSATLTPDLVQFGPTTDPYCVANSGGLTISKGKVLAVDNFAGNDHPNLVCVWGGSLDDSAETNVCGLGMDVGALRYNGLGHNWYNSFGGSATLTASLSSSGVFTVPQSITTGSIQVDGLAGYWGITMDTGHLFIGGYPGFTGYWKASDGLLHVGGMIWMGTRLGVNLLCLWGSADVDTDTNVYGLGVDSSTLRYNGVNHAWYNSAAGPPLLTMDLNQYGDLSISGSMSAGSGSIGGYMYANHFLIGSISDIHGFWRYSDGHFETNGDGIFGGMLTVGGYTNGFTNSANFLNSTGAAAWTAYNLTAQPISIVTAQGIYIGGGSYWTASDERKKSDVVADDPAWCASAVAAVRLVTYDTVDKRGRQRGFIAQQVADVVPEAVSRVRDAVPSVMEIARVASTHSFVLEGAAASLVGEHVVGVRVITEKKSEDLSIRSVRGNVVTVDAELPGERVFVFGPIVDDFHALDYHHMWGVAFGAVQHLLTEHDALERRVRRLESLATTP